MSVSCWTRPSRPAADDAAADDRPGRPAAHVLARPGPRLRRAARSLCARSTRADVRVEWRRRWVNARPRAYAVSHGEAEHVRLADTVADAYDGTHTDEHTVFDDGAERHAFADEVTVAAGAVGVDELTLRPVVPAGRPGTSAASRVAPVPAAPVQRRGLSSAPGAWHRPSACGGWRCEAQRDACASPAVRPLRRCRDGSAASRPSD